MERRRELCIELVSVHDMVLGWIECFDLMPEVLGGIMNNLKEQDGLGRCTRHKWSLVGKCPMKWSCTDAGMEQKLHLDTRGTAEVC